MYSDWSGGNMEIHISNMEGEERTLLSKSGNTQIIPRQWSKDGKNLLAYVQDSLGYYTISTVSTSNGDITPLQKTQWTGKFIKGDASISHDGKYICAVRSIRLPEKRGIGFHKIPGAKDPSVHEKRIKPGNDICICKSSVQDGYNHSLPFKSHLMEMMSLKHFNLVIGGQISGICRF